MNSDYITFLPNTIQEHLEYQQIPVLNYTYSTPIFSSFQYQNSVSMVNQYYTKHAQNFLWRINHELLPAAISDYQNSLKTGYPFHPYDVTHTYKITYNENGLLSLYCDLYEFTGGAHGNTNRESQTWCIAHGQLLTLKDFFPDDPHYISNIQNEIIRQINARIKAGNNIYFNNYAELVKQTFTPKNFYLTARGIVIYFQQYDIAPYASGMPSFLISFNPLTKEGCTEY